LSRSQIFLILVFLSDSGILLVAPSSGFGMRSSSKWMAGKPLASCLASSTHLLIQFIYLTAQTQVSHQHQQTLNPPQPISIHLNFPNHPVLSKYISLAFNMSDRNYGYYSGGYNEGYGGGYSHGQSDGYQYERSGGCPDNSHSSGSYSTGNTYGASSPVNLPDHPPLICV
jgi:hypothetical protein